MNLRSLYLAFAVTLVSACSTLPSSGPTGSEIQAGVSDPDLADLGITLVPVDSIAVVPPALELAEVQVPQYDPPPTDMVGQGDVLSITIFEAGVALFGGNGQADPSGGFDPSVRAHKLPPRRVDDDGMIDIPYVGRIRVIGNTTSEIQDKIRAGLKNLSQDPQVLVDREQVIGNSIIISGEVNQPGRLVLQTNNETLADAVALAGGYRGEAKNLVMLFQRGDNSARMRLSDVMAGAYRGLRAYPGDRLTVISDPMTFSVLGATGRVQQMPFSRNTMNVLEAIATAGGPNPNSGDPKAVFLFRYNGPNETEPTVYHFNMMQTPTYFLAQQFALHDGDVLYFGNSASNQPRKAIQTVGQLFAPIVTATAAAYNINRVN